MRWPVLLLVGLVFLLSAAEATARPPSWPGTHVWGSAGAARAAAPGSVTALRHSAPTADLAPCDEVPGALCGRVVVPLDRDQPGLATIGIFFAVFPHTSGPATPDGTIVTTFGGPGSSATQEGGEGFVSYLFGPLRERRDVVLIDYRGTGLSDAINCESLQNGSLDDFYANVAECGSQLGSRSDLYGSDDVAADIEAVRAALGLRRFDYYGFSYGAADAQAYAVRHPRRLRSVVLDAPFPFPRFDPWATQAAGSVATIVDRVCRRSDLCRSDIRDPVGEVAWLARRLRQAPVDGVARDSLGDLHTVHIDEPELVQVLLVDFGLTSQGEIGAAARALRAGDPVPLLRLDAETKVSFEPPPPELFSAGLNSARFCTDQRFQWDPLASPAERARQFAAARDRLGRWRFAPFSIDGWVAPAPRGAFLPDPCIGWPAPTHVRPRPIPRGANAPGVPALVLAGEYDIFLPPGTVRNVRKVFPHSQQVDVAVSEHVTAFNANGECAVTLIQRFLGTGATGDTSCARSAPFAFPALGRFPRTSADARPATPASAEDRSTLADRRLAAMAAATVTDAMRRAFMAGPTDHGRGLRGGFANAEFDDTGLTVDLALDHFVEDLGVTGQGRYDFETGAIDANVALVVPGSFGQVQVSGVWFAPGATVLTVDGQIGGRRVVVEVPAA
jgi:pimeloyl-ACP methyl ester carboxylesterase